MVGVINGLEVRSFRRVGLEGVDLVAAWPGMGMLAVLVADHLRKELGCELFAEAYSRVNSVSFVDGILESTRVRHRFYGGGGVVVCVGESQPLTTGEVYEVAEEVLRFVKRFKVRRVYTSAASLSTFSGEPGVFGIVNDGELLGFLEKFGVPAVRGEGRITGLNGVLLGVARRLGLEGVCLLGQIRYMDVPQPRSASAVLRVLSRMLEVEVDVRELEEEAERIDESLRERGKEYRRGRGGERVLDYIG